MAENCANPLLARWLKEWMDEARERNSKGYTVYKKAYESVKACPLTFSHPSEAQQLNGLGPKLCDRLSQKLKDHCEQNGLPMPEKRKRKSSGTRDAQRADSAGSDDPDHPSPPRKARKSQLYVPKLRSGPYALILALATLDQESNQGLSKGDLIALAQPHCDASFTTPSDPTKFFTAWNSMKTLEGKELVCTKGRPTKKYYLSDEGWEVAVRMRATLGGHPASLPKQRQRKSPTDPQTTAADPDSSRASVPRPASSMLPPQRSQHPAATHFSDRSERQTVVEDNLLEPELEFTGINSTHSNDLRPALLSKGSPRDPVILPAGSFEVRMVLDMREVRTTSDRDYISGELKKLDVTPVLRSLPLGDVLWIAEVKPAYQHLLNEANLGDHDDDEREIVLEHILERKRLDDLISSIKDGRFHEQKFRLHKSGIKNVTYLVEEYTISAERSEKYGEALESAIASMQVVDNFFVKQTSKLDDTIRYLARMTKTLKGLYENKDIHVVPPHNFEVDSMVITMDRLREAAPANIYAMTFSVFSTMCDKSDSMTLRDVYLKMLMCARGLTGDKAVEIQKIWPTPRALVDAYGRRETELERKNMISDQLGNAIPRKKVGKTLSAKVAEIWG